MAKRDTSHPIGIVDEMITQESVRITRIHLGNEVYEVRVTSKDGSIIEESDAIERGRAWGVYRDQCRYYEMGGGEDLEGILDLDEGLPEDVRGYSTY
tara:strand:- start:505 stop:795 length:291 start_codon:yes stop_codon:yes gene_type:complete